MQSVVKLMTYQLDVAVLKPVSIEILSTTTNTVELLNTSLTV
jgi:hypothetical protein